MTTYKGLFAGHDELYGKPQVEDDEKSGKLPPTAPVRRCWELDRVVNIPRASVSGFRIPVELTEGLARPGCYRPLWAIQSQGLYEARIANGLLAPIGVGHGKALICLLAQKVMHDVKRAVYLTYSQLVKPTIDVVYPEWNKQYFLPRLNKELFIIAYEKLSNAKHEGILEEIGPDLIIVDEAHALRNRTAARTKRFLRYFKHHPGTRLLALSGTLTTRSLKDYAHLAELALGNHSPLPHKDSYSSLMEWADAIDVPQKNAPPRPPGALLDLCTVEEKVQVAMGKLNPTKAARMGYRRRLTDTLGVVATEEGSLGTSLIIKGRKPRLPERVQLALDDLRATWAIGDLDDPDTYEELQDAMALNRVAKQIALGFYYVWDWPKGVVDHEWMSARKEWHKEVREKLKQSLRGMDSPLLLARAAEAGTWRSETWKAWKAVKDRPKPPTKTIWLDDFIVHDVQDYLRKIEKEKSRTVIWFEHRALGEKLAAECPRVTFADAGPQGNDALNRAIVGGGSVIASFRAHGTGKNLQAFSRALFLCPMASGTKWEQGLGREHRPGQLADDVIAEVYVHTDEFETAFGQALRDAEYQQSTLGAKQKLLYATRIDLPGAVSGGVGDDVDENGD